MIVGTRLGAMSYDGGIELARVVVGYDSSIVGTAGSLLVCTIVREAEWVSEMEMEALQEVDKMVVGSDGTGLVVLGVDDGMGVGIKFVDPVCVW